MLAFDINNFGPFHPDVWGTFSDWLMVIVASITAIYLYKTFKSQQNLTWIEQKRYIESIKPVFDLQISHTKISPKGFYDIDTSFVFQNNGGMAKDVSINIFTNNDPNWRFYQTKKEMTLPLTGDTILAGIINGRYQSEERGAACTFIFEYKDLIGNLYKQYIVCSFLDTEHKVTNSIPYSHGGGKLSI